MTINRDLKNLVRARMAETGENYTRARAWLDAEREEAARFYERTVRIFLPGGALTTIPVKRRARVIVLLELLTLFEAGRAYPEREVNEILRTVHSDVAYLRRELVDYGFMTRTDGVYRVADAFPEVGHTVADEMPVDARSRFHAAVHAQSPRRESNS